MIINSTTWPSYLEMKVGIKSTKAICNVLYLLIQHVILNNHRLAFFKHLLLYGKQQSNKAEPLTEI